MGLDLLGLVCTRHLLYVYRIYIRFVINFALKKTGCFLDWEKTNQQSWHLKAVYFYTFMKPHFAHEKCSQFLWKSDSKSIIKIPHNFLEFLNVFDPNSSASYLLDNRAQLASLSYQITSDLYWLYFLFKLCSYNLGLFFESRICSQKASCYFSLHLFDWLVFPMTVVYS